MQHGGKDADFTSSAQSFYQTMSIEDLCALGPWVKSVSDPKESLLFLWFASPILIDAMALVRAWGFSYATIAFVWDKERVNPGAYTMSQTEFVLVAKRGRRPKPLGARNVRQLVSSPRQKHSAKPLEIREKIESMYPEANRVELFARGGKMFEPGWLRYGLEVSDNPVLLTPTGPIDFDRAEQ